MSAKSTNSRVGSTGGDLAAKGAAFIPVIGPLSAAVIKLMDSIFPNNPPKDPRSRDELMRMISRHQLRQNFPVWMRNPKATKANSDMDMRSLQNIKKWEEEYARSNPTEVKVGTNEIGPELKREIAKYTKLLTDKRIPPMGYEFDWRTVTFVFTDVVYETFVKAGDMLPASMLLDDKRIFFKTRTLGREIPQSPEEAEMTVEVEAGQVPPTTQETPWTCGPAALKAVLGHYGIVMAEGEIANEVGNAPVLGVRPANLVQGARKLGCHAIASHFADVNALLPFVKNDVPVIVIVDSFLHPGKQGHYVVVTEMGAEDVTLMDPHVEGNKRVLSHADFDARWWHKEKGPDGYPRIAKRLAIVVVPDMAEAEAGAEQQSAAVRKAIGGMTECLTLEGLPPMTVQYEPGIITFGMADELSVKRAYEFLPVTAEIDSRITRIVIKLATQDVFEAGGEKQEEEEPTHGRTAKCKGPSGFFKWAGKIMRGVTKGLVTAFSGGTAAKFYDAAMDKLLKVTEALSAEQLRNWLNNASNEEVYAWAVAKARKNVCLAALRQKKNDIQHDDLYRKSGVRPVAFEGTRQQAGEAAFRIMVGNIGANWGDIPSCMALHACQAIAILDFGGVGALPLIDARVKVKKMNEAYFDWLNVTMAVMKKYGADHPTPPAPAEAVTYTAGAAAEEPVVAEVETDVPNTEWMFEVTYLKQVWPLIEGSRADLATQKKALRVSESLSDNTTFAQYGAAEDVAFVAEALAELRTRPLT